MVKIDKIDRKILYELDKNCRINNQQLAKKVKRSREAVKYRIQQLINKGIITKFTASINPHKMGYKLFKIYLQLRNIQDERKKLIDYLMNLGRVYWMGECDGEWDLIFGIFAKDDIEFYKLKNDIITKFKHIIVKRAAGTFIDSKQYVKQYFTNQITPPVEFGGKIVFNELDKVDHAILEELVNNARISINELAKKVKSTPTIVRNKIKKLEEKEIIIQYRISVDIYKLGYEIFKPIIYLESISRKREIALYTYIGNIPNIHYFIRNITPWEIEFEFAVQSYEEYLEIINKIKSEFSDIIRNIETVLMRTDEWMPGYKNLILKNN